MLLTMLLAPVAPAVIVVMPTNENAPTARAVVERQLTARPRPAPPVQSAAEAERIRTRYLERIGEKLEPRAAAQDEGSGRR